ncbi:hypothetical protein MTBPR1_100042 [Candidatus Terasakiella magnetica]|uniref:Tail fiber protein n=1 Tax=Candidatus Terasakiella magnetica TaxID=1867952 RepID=A0A1C3RDU6_9PROT|nr:hypothetical protein [Candidatus Terasakiella magnetica]SCA55401.1 hypothetical protein MTBPR1_100042 [Candidatus Terasakiella magnetica]
MSENIVIGDVRPRIQALGDGVQSEFIYPFPIFKETDLEVYLDETLQSAGFSISGVGQSEGGSVVFDLPPANNVVVTLRRYLVIERTSDFAEGGAFHASVINKELDYLTAVSQQNAEDLQRAVMLNPTDGDAALVLPSKVDRADGTLAFDGDGLPIVGPGVAEITSAQTNAQAATQAAIDAMAAQVAAEAARDEAQTFDPNDYRAVIDLIETADVADGAITQDKIDPNVSLGGPTLNEMYDNADTITIDTTIPAGRNAFMAGPVTIANGVTVTVNGTFTVV